MEEGGAQVVAWSEFISTGAMLITAWVVVMVILFITVAAVVAVYRLVRKDRW